MVTDLPSSSIAAVLERPGEPLVLREVPMPREIEHGALLVKVETATVCGSDVHLWDGSFGAMSQPLPVILGHEFVGRVVAFGEGAQRDSVGVELELGDRIVWTHESCGSCYACTVQREPGICDNRRHYMFLRCDEYPYLTGGFSEYCYVMPKSGRLRVPDEVPSEWASAASCALRTVLQGFERVGRITPWDTVVVQGSGPLGLFGTAVANVAGAGTLIVVGAPDRRLALATEWGADHVISVESTDAEQRAEQVAELTGGRGADIVLELSGAPGAFKEGLDFVARGGRYVVVGQVGSNVDSISPALVTKKHVDILGSWSSTTAHYWEALEFIRRTMGRFDFGAMISNRYPLSEINVALDGMSRFTEIKPAIYPNGH